MKDWGILLHGTETEPGRPGGNDNKSSKKPSTSWSTDGISHSGQQNQESTTDGEKKGSTEEREKENISSEIPAMGPSKSSSPPTPSPSLVLLPSTPGCQKTDSTGACLGWCIIVLFVHSAFASLVFGFSASGNLCSITGQDKDLNCNFLSTSGKSTLGLRGEHRKLDGKWPSIRGVRHASNKNYKEQKYEIHDIGVHVCQYS